jgi:hypothetical protein
VADHDLELLRSFRREDTEPPEGLQERIEERLWQSILAEEAGNAPARPRGVRRWYHDLLRPAVAAGAAASIAIGVAIAGDGGGAGLASCASVSRAGVLDSTAVALFGDSAATTSAPISGAIDVSEGADDDEIAKGPSASSDVARSAPRDPEQLYERLHASAEAVAGTQQADRAAFHIAMQWIGAPQVPGDLRAAMLRSLERLPGIEGALVGVDRLGRTGVVLGHLDPATGLRSQYLLDPDGGRLLESRTLTTVHVDPACPPGTYTGHDLYDTQGRPVQPADAPWLDWPLVVAACSPPDAS